MMMTSNRGATRSLAEYFRLYIEIKIKGFFFKWIFLVVRANLMRSRAEYFVFLEFGQIEFFFKFVYIRFGFGKRKILGIIFTQ